MRIVTDHFPSVLDRQKLTEQCFHLCQRFYRKIFEINMFEDGATWIDEKKRRIQLYTTRFYVFLLVIAITLFCFYETMNNKILTITIDHPLESTFHTLANNQSAASTTLQCPCKQISLSRRSFVSIKLHFHQICSSDFVQKNEQWLAYVYNPLAVLIYPYDDFRLSVGSYFRWLTTLCSLANQASIDAIDEYLSDGLISIHVQQREMIVSQMNNTLRNLRSSIEKAFLHRLHFIRKVIQDNGIITLMRSNWYLSSERIGNGASKTLRAKSRTYNNDRCSCAVNSTCSSPARIDETLVPGFRVGCDPLEALLQSTLECLYDYQCISLLNIMNGHLDDQFHTLDLTLSAVDATVESLVNSLMIDQWDMQVNYSAYYASCAPSSCTYSIEQKVDLIYLVTVILGFYGGLSAALKTLAQIIIKITKFILVRRRQRLLPVVITVAPAPS